MKLRQALRLKTGLTLRTRFALIGSAFSVVVAIIFFGFFGFQTGSPEKALAAITNYTSLRDGPWTNSTNVWSTNGSTACGCTPGASVSGSVVINHAINMNTDISIASGGRIDVSAASSLIQVGQKLTITSGILEAYGLVSVKEITINASGTGLFYGPVTVDSKFFVEGTVLFDSLTTITNASLELRPGSVTTAGDGWEIDIPNGNIYNQGTMTFLGTCLIMNNGSFYNQVGGRILGEGFIETENGNFYNSGIIWDTDVNWCASGTGSGMLEPEDCLTGFCNGGSPLPVTLVSFTAEAANNASVVLNWATVAEVNNDYFTIERSANGNQFSELTRVDGVGNSTVLHKYSFTDFNPFNGKSYYRLKQTDYNGQAVFFKIVPVTVAANEETKNTVMVSPNPFTEGFTAQFECTEKEEVVIALIAANGAVVFSDKIIADEGNNLYRFAAPANFKPGTYLLKIGNSKTVFATKKVICR